jgi:hypothetical protein
MRNHVYKKIFRLLCFFLFLNSRFLLAQSLDVTVTPPGNPPGNYEICVGEELPIVAVVTGGTSPYSYNWSGNGASFLDNTSLSQVVFLSNIASSFVLHLTVTDALFDVVTITLNITVKPLPNLIGSNGATICQGNSVNLWAANAANFLWFDSNDNLIGFGSIISVSPLTTTTYILLGITNGCAKTKEITVMVNEAPIADSGPDIQICNGTSVLLDNAYAQNYSSIQWTTSGDGIFSDASDMNPEYFPGTNDMINGSVILTMTAYGVHPCPLAHDQLLLIL